MMNPAALPENFLAQCAYGATAPWRAAQFIRAQRLVGLCATPALVCAVLFAWLTHSAITTLWPTLLRANEYMAAFGMGDEFIQTGLRSLGWVAILLVVPLVVVTCALAVLLFARLITSPILERISSRVEALIRGVSPAPETMSQAVGGFGMALSDMFVGTFYLGAFSIPVLLLSFIPGVGTIAFIVLGAFMLSQEFMGLPMTRKRLSYAVRWRMLMFNKWFALGFGGALTLLFMVPLLNCLVLSLAVVGGTLLYCELEAAQRIPAHM